MDGMDRLTTISDPRTILDGSFLLNLHEYWAERRGKKPVLDRADVDPTDIPTILPHLYLTDVLPDGGFRVRLIGTHMVQRLGWDPTGKKISEILNGQYLEYVHSFLYAAVEARNPVFCESNYSIPGKDFLRVKRLILPMTHGGTTIDQLMIGQEFLDQSRQPTPDYQAIIEQALHQPMERALIAP